MYKITSESAFVVTIIRSIILRCLNKLLIGPVGPVSKRPGPIDLILVDELVANTRETVLDAQRVSIIVQSHIRVVRVRMKLSEKSS